ncbi:hypothetical protein KC968_01870 [Candidatus Saccharibacteria bacterium]|nr:hypothetical protein [Candidatus Saccharibacteria bacterium]
MNAINRMIRISLAGFIAFSSLLMVVMPHKVLAFSGGTGTSSDPYQISTPAELASLSSYLGAGNSSKYFELANDINLDVAPYNTGSGWTPIGNNSSQFNANFDGNGHTISGLYINRPSSSRMGLFGYVTGNGVVKNVTLANVNITGYEYTGGLIGYYNSTSTVENTYVSGTVTGGGSNGGIGGVIGWCHTSAGTIRHSTSSADITGTTRTGGLVGYAYCPIEESASTGNVNTTSVVGWSGGLTGANVGGILNSYATGDVIGPTGGSKFGGLVGGNFSTITNAYSTGPVTVPSGSNIGGLVGYSSGGSATNAFWDS